MESFRHMPLENIQNCRDLGGYPIKGGGFTKYGSCCAAADRARPRRMIWSFSANTG